MNQHPFPSDIFGLAKVVPPLSRRGFMSSSVAAGYTLAAGPVRADVIHTDTEGLDAGEAKVNVCRSRLTIISDWATSPRSATRRT